MQDEQIDCCFAKAGKWFRYRAAAIIVEENALLLAGNAGTGHLYTVGGGVHVGESAEECVLREMHEETGVQFEVERLAVVCENFFRGNDTGLDGMDCHTVELYFLMRRRGTQALAPHGRTWDGRREDMHWVPLDDLRNVNVKPDFLRTQIPRILRSEGIAHFVQIPQEYTRILGQSVRGVIDRPLGSRHPSHSEMTYPVNYGYVTDVFADDGAEQDVYVLGADNPLKTFCGKVIAIWHRTNDVEDKWIVSLDGRDYSDAEIMEKISFQERFFEGRLIR